MTKENKEVKDKVEDTTEQDASLAEINEDEMEDSLEDEVDSPDASQEELNYSELYEQEKEAREKAEKKIVNMKRSQKEESQEDEPDEDNSDDVEQKVQQAVSAFREEFIGETVEEILGALSSNEDEKKLIKFHYNNTIKQSGVNAGSIKRDLQRAKLLANETLYSNKAEELDEEGKRDASITNSSVGTNRDVRKPQKRVQLNAQERAILERRGIDPDNFKN